MVLQFLSYLTGDADPSSSSAAASSSDDLDEEARDAAVSANWQRYWTSQPPADLLRLRRSHDLQKLVRRGVPMVTAPRLAALRRAPCTRAVAELVASAPALLRRSAAAKQIDKDLHRTYGAMRGVRVPQHEAVASLRNVLLAYAAHNAEVGYCQSMNFLAAVLLLVADEETAFWCLVALVERVLPGHFSSSMAMSLVDQGVLRELLGELDPELMGHLDSLGVAPSLVTTQWLLTCFVGAALPLGTLLRLWDCLLYELSPAFLLRAAAALFLLRGPRCAPRPPPPTRTSSSPLRRRRRRRRRRRAARRGVRRQRLHARAGAARRRRKAHAARRRGLRRRRRRRRRRGGRGGGARRRRTRGSRRRPGSRRPCTDSAEAPGRSTAAPARPPSAAAAATRGGRTRHDARGAAGVDARAGAARPVRRGGRGRPCRPPRSGSSSAARRRVRASEGGGARRSASSCSSRRRSSRRTTSRRPTPTWCRVRRGRRRARRPWTATVVAVAVRRTS